MNLKSFGCSFVFGTDLADAGNNLRNPSKNTWPALVAQHQGREYQCYAKPGSGNLSILEQILIQATTSTPDDMFVIVWTWIDRFDYQSPNQTTAEQVWQWDHPETGKVTNWSTLLPTDTANPAQTYYRDLHSEYRDKFTCLTYVKMTLDTLKQKGIPFVMSYMDELLLDQRWHTTSAVIDLQSYIKPHMIQFEGQTFLEWSRTNGFAISSKLHPLEDAHRSAFELVKNQSFL